MSYLVDTNVMSEFTRPRPDLGVQAWFERTPEHELHLSAITIAELRRGVTRMPAGKRRSALGAWLDFEILQRFSDRIVDVDVEIANAWGELMASGEKRGIVLHPMDSFIAATAMTRSMRLVTRNTRDFGKLRIELVNPWSA